MAGSSLGRIAVAGIQWARAPDTFIVPSIIERVTAALRLAAFEERHVAGPGGPRRAVAYRAGGEGTPVVLVHGLGGSSLNWVEIAPALARRQRVLLPDLPGHGASAPPPPGAGLDHFADAVAAVIAAERAAPAYVVGHSFGGLVTCRLAARTPAVVAGVLLAAAAGLSSSRRLARATLEVLAVVRPGRRLAPQRYRIAASERLRATVFTWWGAADPGALSADAAEGFLAGWERHTDTISAMRAMATADVGTDVARIRCPVLVLWGARDNQVGVGDAFRYARSLRAPVRVIADCGHLLIAERPEAVLDAISWLLRAARDDDLWSPRFARAPSGAAARAETPSGPSS
jgi:pimeloyl-ACP methyl ester carboxylesterase